MLPRLPTLVPNPQPRVQPNLPTWQPTLQPESPFLWPFEHVKLFKVEYSGQKKWHTIWAHVVVHMPSCLHVLFCVAHPLYSNQEGVEGTATWGMFPLGCVARRWLLYKGGGEGWLARSFMTFCY